MRNLPQSKVVELTGEEWRLLWQSKTPLALGDLLRRATVDPRTWQLKFSTPEAAGKAFPLIAQVVEPASWRWCPRCRAFGNAALLHPEVKAVRAHRSAVEPISHEPRRQVFFRSQWRNVNTVTCTIFLDAGAKEPLFVGAEA